MYNARDEEQEGENEVREERLANAVNHSHGDRREENRQNVGTETSEAAGPAHALAKTHLGFKELS